MSVHTIQMSNIICTSDPVQSVAGNTNLRSAGGGSYNARVKRDCFNVWEEDWSE